MAGSGPTEPMVTSSTRTTRGSTWPRSTPSSTAGSSPPSARRTARWPDVAADVTAARAEGPADLARRDGPRLDRDPGQDRPRRGRHHHRGDRGQRPRLPRPRPLALGPERQGRGGDVRLLRRPGGGRARPGPGRQGPARRARRAGGQADDDDRGAPGRADPVRKARGRCRHGRQPAGPDRAPGGARRIPISSSTSGWSASGATSSTSTSTRSRWPSRRPSSRSASATRRCRP